MTHQGTARYDHLTEADDLRIRFFDHSDLLTTEVDVAAGYAVQLGRLRPPR